MMKNKKNAHKGNITINHWLSLKPYLTHKEYDIYYLGIANTVFEELAKEANQSEIFDMNKEELKQLSCILTSYFEDYVSNIGLWRTFTLNNMELHGYYLPFYNLDTYKFDELNKQDIMYLCWHYVILLYDEVLFNPDDIWFQRIAHELYSLFKSEEGEAYNTDYYETYFKVEDGCDYFDFKSKLHWLATKSYLVGIYFDREYRLQIDEIMEEVKKAPAQYDMNHVNLMFYTMLNDYLYTKKSCFNALTTPEWFSKIANCSEKKRHEIYQLQYPHKSWYEYQSKDKKYFYLKGLQNSKTYNVLWNSVNKNSKFEKESIIETTLIKWNDEWWVTGSAAGMRRTAKEIADYKATAIDNSWILDELVLKVQKEDVKNFAESLQAYCGEPFFIAKNMREAEDMCSDFVKFHRNRLNNSLDVAEINFSKFNKKTESIVFFINNQGMEIAIHSGDIIKLLTTKELADKEIPDAFFTIFDTNDVRLNNMLLEKYQPPFFLKFPNNSQISMISHKDFLFRLFNPDDDYYQLYPTIYNGKS